MINNKLVSIVVPVYNEDEVIDFFYSRMKKVVDSLKPLSYEIIFIDDGSTDNSYEALKEIACSDEHVKIVKFSRNFGHQVAITAGIRIAEGDAVAVIDADLQDPPEVIPDFVGKWEEGYDVVYGVRRNRKGESRLKLMTAAMFYRLLKRMIKIDIPVDTGDFRLMNRRVVDKFLELKENDRFVRGLVSWIGFKQIGMYYERDERYAGETKYPYRKMIKFALDGITSFSSVPLKLASWFGYITSCFAFFYGIFIFIQRLLGISIPGFATVVIGMFFLGGIQLICLGIIGEYVGRIFNETKRRPMYVIDHIFNFKSTVDNSEREPVKEKHPSNLIQ